jgi:hypothetical protein
MLITWVMEEMENGDGVERLGVPGVRRVRKCRGAMDIKPSREASMSCCVAFVSPFDAARVWDRECMVAADVAKAALLWPVSCARSC